MQRNYDILKDFVLENGGSLFGVCEIERLKGSFHLSPQELQGMKYGISIAVRLSKAVLDGIQDGPTLLYKWHYRQANIQLDKLAFLLSLKIQEMGYRALPIPASQIIDWKRQIGHLSHRLIAVEAGLGWLGRNNLVVNEKYGAQIRLVTVLTDIPLKVDKKVEFGCGDCYECVKACPVQALGGEVGQYDFHKCFDLLTQFARKRNLGVYICGLCLKPCSGR